MKITTRHFLTCGENNHTPLLIVWWKYSPAKWHVQISRCNPSYLTHFHWSWQWWGFSYLSQNTCWKRINITRTAIASLKLIPSFWARYFSEMMAKGILLASVALWLKTDTQGLSGVFWGLLKISVHDGTSVPATWDWNLKLSRIGQIEANIRHF